MGKCYLIEGPAIIAFSGGRTSGFMLKQILEAHEGRLPHNVFVCFANTGKEHEETLRFVHNCETKWDVKIHWLERSDDPRGFSEVNHNSAARSGEPFAKLIQEKGYLPNSQMRYCSIELKIRVMRDFARSMDWKRWDSVIGLRADEGHRAKSALRRNASGKEPFRAVMPMYHAGASERDVLAWWSEQDFDLRLHSFQGNCDACFLKSRPKLFEVERTAPGTLEWWARQETRMSGCENPNGRVFKLGDSYAGIQDAVSRQADLFKGVFDNDPAMDAECGTICEGAA